jgi:hypothetical protein
MWAAIRPLLSALDAEDWPSDKDEQLVMVGRNDAGQLCAFISAGARGELPLLEGSAGIFFACAHRLVEVPVHSSIVAMNKFLNRIYGHRGSVPSTLATWGTIQSDSNSRLMPLIGPVHWF